MNAEQVLAGVSLKSTLPAELASAQVSGLAYDSRQVGAEYLFFGERLLSWYLSLLSGHA